MVERGRRSTLCLWTVPVAAALAIALAPAAAVAQCAFGPERVQDEGSGDTGSAFDGNIDGDMERRPPGADRDAPSEDDTARDPSEDGASPGCTFRRGPLELLV
ncbi:MAG: hypothetical protein ACT4OU_00875 [Hyphomicrobium sp.]